MALQMTPKVKIKSCKAKTGMASNHPRNTGPMCSSPRCGAKTRSRDPCKSPAVFGKKRCPMHGGAAGSGAPEKNQNALKHGRYTRRRIEERHRTRAILREARKLIKEVESR